MTPALYIGRSAMNDYWIYSFKPGIGSELCNILGPYAADHFMIHGYSMLSRDLEEYQSRSNANKIANDPSIFPSERVYAIVLLIDNQLHIVPSFLDTESRMKIAHSLKSICTYGNESEVMSSILTALKSAETMRTKLLRKESDPSGTIVTEKPDLNKEPQKPTHNRS